MWCTDPIVRLQSLREQDRNEKGLKLVIPRITLNLPEYGHTIVSGQELI